jgi:hypothetical protein
LSGQQHAQIAPGRTQSVYMTAPPNTTSTQIFLTPGADGKIESAQVGLIGRCGA